MTASISEQLWRVRARLLRIILRAENRRALYEALCQHCVGVGSIHMAWVGEAVDGRLQPVAWAGIGAHDYARGAQVDLDPPSARAEGPSGQAFRGGTLVVCNDYQTDASTRPWRDRAAAFGVRSSAALPLRSGTTTVGVLNLYARQSAAFDPALQDLLGELLDDLAQGLDHQRRFDELARLQQQAQQNLQQMRQVFDMLPAFVAIVSPQAQFLEINSEGCRFFGLPRERILGRTVDELGMGIVARDRDAVRSRVDATGSLQNFETQLVGAEGRVIDTVTNITRISYHGAPANLNISVDVTERKRAVDLVARHERQLNHLVESASDAIINLDAGGRVVVFNQKAVDMFGVSRAQALGRSLDRFIPVASRSLHARLVHDVLADAANTKRQMGVRRAIHGLRADGTVFPVEATLSVVGEGAGRMATVIVRDVTVFQQAEQARLAALEASALADAKARFFSRMSHELRTPLTAVLGYSQLLAENAGERLTRDDRDKLQQVLRAGTQLRSLVDDVLSYSQVQAGQVKVEIQSVSLAELLHSVLQMCLPEAAQHDVSLTLDTLPAPQLQLQTDPLRLRQVLLNLVSNALKYNRPGGWVRLGADVAADRLRLTVVDNGIGMSPTQLSDLFQPFNRLGRERSSVEGTGLGLALVHELVALLGGSVIVNSQESQGTQVELSLPLPVQPPPAPLAMAEPAAPAAGAADPVCGLVLYIEDSEINTMLVTELFHRLPGARLELAATGSEGLRMARATRPDLVLLDMHLPDLAGLAVLHELRRDASLHGLPIVVLSASATQEDVSAALAAGATDYWTKPIDFEQFVAGVRAYLVAADPA